MKFQFSSGDQSFFAEATVDEAQIYGHGGSLSPTLFFSVQLHISYRASQPEMGLEILLLDGKLSANNIPLGCSRVSPVNVLFHAKFDTLHQYPVNLEFPISLSQLHFLEQNRTDAGVKLKLDFQLVYQKLKSSAGAPSSQYVQGIWGHIQTAHTTAYGEFTIPRDIWIERVLPNVGFGRVLVLEFPAAPIESCQAIEHSFKALKQAVEQHKLGFYDEAAGKCRVAIDPFFERELVDPSHPELPRIPVVRKSWEAKLGKATYEWLNASLGSIKWASNAPHHSPYARFGQFDSQMIITITANFIAFIARSQKPEDLK